MEVVEVPPLVVVGGVWCVFPRFTMKAEAGYIVGHWSSTYVLTFLGIRGRVVGSLGPVGAAREV